MTEPQADSRNLERWVQIVGTLMAQDVVTLANEVSTTIAKILVDLDDRVRAGRVLIKLDEREPRLEVERMGANLQAARETLSRARQILDSSLANVERARAMLTDAKINLTRYQELIAEGAVSASQRDTVQTRYKEVQQEIMQMARVALGKFPDLRVSAQQISLSGGGFKQRPFTLVIRGPELDHLAQYAQDVIARLKRIIGFVDLDTNLAARRPRCPNVPCRKSTDINGLPRGRFRRLRIVPSAPDTASWELRVLSCGRPHMIPMA